MRWGKKLGYENFLPLGYYRMQRNSYDKNDVEKFRAAVQKYVVPVAVKVYERQAKRLGKTYPMSYADMRWSSAPETRSRRARRMTLSRWQRSSTSGAPPRQPSSSTT